MSRFNRPLLALALLACTGSSAIAHVTLPPGGATVGTDYEAAFRVGHACKDATLTNALTVRLPQGFALKDVPARPGWSIEQTLSGNEAVVRWTATSASTAVPADQKTEFVLRGRLPDKPGPLYFKVLQGCDVGSSDWAQLPTGAADEKLPLPAAKLDVLPRGVAAVDVRDGWARMAVAGQSGTGAFMKLQAPSGARLVGASTPVAGIAEVHEMSMQGDHMQMRAVDELALPARQTVELRPGGLHVMLMDLKQPLPVGSTLPLTLRFKDAQGNESTREVQLPVRAAPAAAAGSGGHQH